MKILVYFASPRKNGNTQKMLDAFLSALPDSAEVNVLSAYEMNALPCIACNGCEKELRCVRHDLDFTDEYLINADVVVFATPIYNSSVPSPLKAIFDRFQKFYAAIERGASPFEKKRKGFILLTLGRSGKVSIPLAEAQIINAFNSIGCEYSGTAYANFTDTQEVTPVQLKNAAQLAASVQ